MDSLIDQAYEPHHLQKRTSIARGNIRTTFIIFPIKKLILKQKQKTSKLKLCKDFCISPKDYFFFCLIFGGKYNFLVVSNNISRVFNVISNLFIFIFG